MHTPGPWHRNIRAGGKYPVVFSGRNNYVATVSQQKDGQETEANIDLISAAPDLLAAAENARNVLAALVTGDLKEVKADSPALLALRAAIAKAEGGL